MIRTLLRVTPPRVLRAADAVLRRPPFTSPAVRPHVVRVLDSIRRGETTIDRGIGAGLRFDAVGSRVGFALGTDEPFVQDALARYLQPGGVLYDVGANVGFFTMLGLRLVGPTGFVCAFEPLPANVAALKRNVELNDFSNVIVVERAAAARSGRGSLRLTGEPTGASLADDGGLEVEVVAIDDAVAELGLRPPTVVKIDVEGAELAVLEGLGATLARARPVVICELHGTHGLFDALDYRVSERSGAHVLALPR